MPKMLAIVFWSDEFPPVTDATFHLIDGEPTPDSLGYYRGLALQEFGQNQGIARQQIENIFSPELLEWGRFPEYGLTPESRQGLQTLADLIRLPIIVYTYHTAHNWTPCEQLRFAPAT